MKALTPKSKTSPEVPCLSLSVDRDHIAEEDDIIWARTRHWSLARLKQELKHRHLSISGSKTELLKRVIKAHQYDESNGWVWSQVSGSFYKRVSFDGEGINPSSLIGRHMHEITQHSDGTITLRFLDTEDHKAVVYPPGSAKIYCRLFPFPKERWIAGELKMVMDATVALCQCVRENAASTVKTIGFRFEGSEQMEYLRCWKHLGQIPGHVHLDAFWNPLDL